MPELTPEIVSEVVEVCNTEADEAAEAFGRALDMAETKLTVGEPANVEMQSLPEGFDGPGLVVVLTLEGAAAVVLIPQKSGIVPEWCEKPDPTGQSKLQTLAQELGMTLLPEQFMPTDFAAGWAKTLAGAIARGGVVDGAAMVPLELAAQEKSGTAMLIWPAAKSAAVLGAAAAKPADAAPVDAAPAAKTEAPSPQPKPKAISGAAALPQKGGVNVRVQVGDLPDYSRSLLKIEVPVVVTLAEKRQPLRKIIELGPGSIIHFEKSCEEMLQLDVGGRHVAKGEAVKVGDKFGLRITSMLLPEERFKPVESAS